MVHRNYHEIYGATPAECGYALGRLFGAAVRDYLSEARDDDAWPRRVQQARPLLAQTARYFPALMEELEAYARAARMSLLDLWTLSIEGDLDDGDYERCTTVVTNNGQLIAHNEDWDPDAADDICILKRRCGSVTTLELYYYGCPLGGAALSICSRGYVQAINSLDHSDWQTGVPGLVVARRLSELSSADAELEKLLVIPRSSGFAHTLVDAHGQITAVECTATEHSLRQPSSPWVHTNHLLAPELSSLQDDTDGKSTFRRYEAACTLARPSMTMMEMKRLLSDESRGGVSSLFNRNTIARAIVDLEQRTASFWLRREHKKGWIDYPIDFFAHAAELSS